MQLLRLFFGTEEANREFEREMRNRIVANVDKDLKPGEQYDLDIAQRAVHVQDLVASRAYGHGTLTESGDYDVAVSLKAPDPVHSSDPFSSAITATTMAEDKKAYDHSDPVQRAARWEQITQEQARIDERLNKSLAPVATAPSPAPMPKKEVEIKGDITPSELAALKAKYGDTLVSVTSVDPNDMQKVNHMHGHLYRAIWEESRDRQMSLVFDMSLIGLYHLNRAALPEFPFDHEQSYVKIDPKKGVTPENERAIRARFGVTDEQMERTHKAFDTLRADMMQHAGDAAGDDDDDPMERPLYFFGQIRPDDIQVVQAYDSVERTTVFAAGVRLPIGRGTFMMSDACVNCAKHVFRALIASDRERARRTLNYRVAWMQQPNSELMGIYATFGAEDTTKRNADNATHEAAVTAITQMLDKTQFFDAPAPNVMAALQGLADIAVPIAETIEKATHKEAGSDVTPF